MNDRVQITMDDGVADVRLVRADKMNALDDAMFEALVAAGERLKAEPGVRCVVLSGEGRAFCAGLDMGNFGRMADGSRRPAADGGERLTARTHGVANRAQYAVWVWRELPMPVIAAVHGVAFGGGFQLMLGADMRFVAPDARLAVLEIKWGLVPDMAGTLLMRHLAREIAGRNPDAVRAAKRLLNGVTEFTDPLVGLTQETREQIALIGSPNQVEAVKANLEKRAPAFRD